MAEAPQPKRKTIAALEAAVADLERRRKEAVEARDAMRVERDGKKLAYENAVRQLWPLMGFALRDKLAAGSV